MRAFVAHTAERFDVLHARRTLQRRASMNEIDDCEPCCHVGGRFVVVELRGQRFDFLGLLFDVHRPEATFIAIRELHVQ